MKTHTKSGLLTNYGLSCGYVQTDGTKQLYKEHNTFHVRKSGVWNCFDTLKEARTNYKSL